MINNESIDKYELYSFGIYLYLYVFIYNYIFSQTFVRSILFNILINMGSYFIFDYSIISFIRHKYWHNNLKSIAMPQLINGASNMVLYSNFNSIYITIPSNILIYFLIINMYKNEIKYSKNLRFVINIIFFIFNHLF